MAIVIVIEVSRLVGGEAGGTSRTRFENKLGCSRINLKLFWLQAFATVRRRRVDVGQP